MPALTCGRAAQIRWHKLSPRDKVVGARSLNYIDLVEVQAVDRRVGAQPDIWRCKPQRNFPVVEGVLEFS